MFQQTAVVIPSHYTYLLYAADKNTSIIYTLHAFSLIIWTHFVFPLTSLPNFSHESQTFFFLLCSLTFQLTFYTWPIEFPLCVCVGGGPCLLYTSTNDYVNYQHTSSFKRIIDAALALLILFNVII